MADAGTREKLENVALFLMRFVIGMLFMQHGMQKMFGMFGGMPPGMPVPPPMFTEIWFGGMLELVGGAFVMLGLLTRPAAFIVCGEMAVAYWRHHFKAEKFWPLENRGEGAVLYCFVFLFLAARGGGSISLDALIFKGKQATSAD